MKNFACVAIAIAVASAHGAVLFDNGSFVTGIGNGSGGANTSALTTPDMAFGFGAQVTAGNVVADNFTLASNSTLSNLTVYIYQTGATAVSLTGGAFAIYSTAPTSLTSTPIAGNLATTVAGSAVLTNVFRVESTALTGNTRRIQALTFNLNNLDLAAGSYYVAWSMTGTGTSGPWAVPVVPSPAGSNGLQLIGGAGTFNPLIDAGSNTVKDLAFTIEGTTAPVPEPATFAALGAGVLAMLRRRKKA